MILKNSFIKDVVKNIDYVLDDASNSLTESDVKKLKEARAVLTDEKSKSENPMDYLDKVELAAKLIRILAEFFGS